MFPTKFEIEALNANFLQKVISDEERKANQQVSFYYGIRSITWFGYLNGVFPLSNTFGAKTAGSLNFKKLSWAYIFSWMMFSLKLVTILVIAMIISQYNSSKEYEQSTVDIFAGVVSFGFVFGFGIFAHIQSNFGIHNFLDTIKSIEEFDEKYSCLALKSSMSFYNKVIINTCLGIIIATTPIALNIYMYTTGKGNLVLPLVFTGFYTTNRILISIILTIATFFLEFGTMFLFGKIFGLSAIMTSRLVCITKAIELKSETKSWALKLRDKSWLDLSYQYLHLHTVVEKLENCLSSYFIIMFPALIIGSVCTIYYKINSHSLFATEFGFILLIGIGICCYRIFALADCGEMLERKYRYLIRTLLKVNQNSKFLMDEKKQFKQFLKLVKTIPISLSAGGFFTVNRNNVTSISGVILTYIIVLLQFNMSDKDVNDEHGNHTLEVENHI